jgi:hypothetical protein
MGNPLLSYWSVSQKRLTTVLRNGGRCGHPNVNLPAHCNTPLLYRRAAWFVYFTTRRALTIYTGLSKAFEDTLVVQTFVEAFC